MAFDPDAYLAKNEGGDFDPDAYLAKKEQQSPPATVPSAMESALQGFAQGASYGFVDELAGLGGASRALPVGAKVVAGILSPPLVALESATAPDQPTAEDVGGVLRAYLRARDAARKEDAAAVAAHPIAHGTGSFAGALTTPGPKGLGATKLAKQGAMYGAASGLGGSEADLAHGEILPTLVNTAVSAGTGAILAPIASGLSARFGRFLKEKSQENALKAVGARAGIADALGVNGIKTAEDARALGQTAIDQGLVPPFSKAADVAQNSGFALEREGARVGAVLKDADAIPGAFDLDRAAWQAAGEVMGPQGLTTEAMSKVRPATNIVERIAKQADVDSSFSAANRLKSDIYNGINYGTNATSLGVGMQKGAVRGLRKSIEEQVAEKLGPEAADELISANRNLSALRKINRLSSGEARREIARGGAITAGTIGASLAAGDPSPIVAKAASPYLNSTVSAIQRNLAPATMPLTQAATKPGIQHLSEQEQDSISAFLNGI